MGVIEWVFWLAALSLAYAYVGYPLILGALGCVHRPRGRVRASLPSVSIVISAFNEAECAAAKVRSALAQDYPPELLEVIFVSDGSTDGTDAEVLACSDPRVCLVRQEPRSGKANALNLGVGRATGDILVFTDANAILAPWAVSRLVAALADPAVGLASGSGRYVSDPPTSAGAICRAYLTCETLVKRGESALGFLAGADGAIYALRRELYRTLGPAEINDLLHPILAALAGYRSRFDPYAWTVERAGHSAGCEFRRQVRITAQAMHLLARWYPRLIAARRWRAVWALASHRLLRWTSPLALSAMLIGSVALVEHSLTYASAFILQVGFYALALAGLAAERVGLRLQSVAVPYYFCLVAAAVAAAMVRLVRRGPEAVWLPVRSDSRIAV